MTLATGNKRAPLRERGDDLYETPLVAIEALLRAEPIPDVVWECACGPGNMVTALRRTGRKVWATDLVDYGCPESEHGVDFLMEKAPSFAIGAIVTNPPFKLAGKFVEHALRLGIPKIAMLLRLGFVESKSRSAILDGGLLARILVFQNRLPMMHRNGWDGPRAGSGMAVAWFVWELAHCGPIELRRISWNPAELAE